MAERSRVSRRMADEQLTELRALMSDMPPSVRRDIQYGTGVSNNVRTGNVQPFRRQDLVEALDYASLIPTGLGDVADIVSFGVSALEPGFIRRALTPPQWTPNANPGMRGVDLNALSGQRNSLSYTPPFSLNPSEENLRLASLLPFITGMTAFHGTPHRFKAEKLVELPDGTTRWLDETMDMPQGARVLEEAPLGRFRSSQIGTGEGAQAYGHGIYLAERPGVAGSYRTAGAYKHFFDQVTPQQIAEAFYEDLSPLSDGSVIFGGRMYDKDQFMRSWESGDIDAFSFSGPVRDRVEKSLMPKGHFYTVDLPDDQIEKMLDWDAPLSEQPESVQEAMRSIGSRAAFTDEPIGALMERARRSKHFAGDFIGRDTATIEEVSEVLKEAGIPGIKYFDGGSRAAGEGTRNFVVFDENILKILGRE